MDSEIDLGTALYQIIPKARVKTRLLDRYAYASDASHFYLVPKAVVQPNTVEEIQKLFAFSRHHGESLTFRAAGTSFSGQGVTDGILVDLSNYWREVTTQDQGRLVRVQPGAIGAHVNRALKKYGKKIGPDPASINACMMGGILSNNSSGMCCGVKNNSYHTLSHMTFVLPNGKVFNTEKKEDYRRFENQCPEIFTGLISLRQELRNNKELTARIRQKYLQKNTVGYCINAFLDFDHPLDILTHVIIGGEGTLAFIAEAVLKTIPDLPYKKTGMLYFENPEQACNAIFELKKTGAEALEFMDRASLRSVENMPGVPAFIREFPEATSAILCEFQEASFDALQEKYNKAVAVFNHLPIIRQPEFTDDETEQAILWKIRKGMYPSVAGMRAKGTSTLLEDFTLPVERLGDAVVDIQNLFEKYNYTTGIIFGHAKDGNLHFAVSQSFATQEDIDHYELFNDELFLLILEKYDGALKGEHSTGRAVSAYVEKEWGPDAYRVMKILKKLVDPQNLLNPGIIITQDKFTHIHNLKVMPVVEEEVDRCIECGFCEDHCPSRDYTMTPRRRIVVRRAIERLNTAGAHSERAALLKEYQYDGIDTCAVDGMCATACPVDIDTGQLIKRLRHENHSKARIFFANVFANNFWMLENTAKIGLRIGHAVSSLYGEKALVNFTKAIRKISPSFPLWSRFMGKPISSNKLRTLNDNTPRDKVLYFSTCINRMIGDDTYLAYSNLCKKANIGILVAGSTLNSCCGQIFSSKGYRSAFRKMANSTIEKLYEASKEGEMPIVFDISSCTQTIKKCGRDLNEKNREKFEHLRFYDVVDFCADILLPRLNVTKPKKRIVFHPVCSLQKLGNLSSLKMIGDSCAGEFVIPENARCCGMAGDRGFFFPSLTNSATKRESQEVIKTEYDGYYSSSKTCEIALSDATGVRYESIIKLLDEVTS